MKKDKKLTICAIIVLSCLLLSFLVALIRNNNNYNGVTKYEQETVNNGQIENVNQEEIENVNQEEIIVDSSNDFDIKLAFQDRFIGFDYFSYHRDENQIIGSFEDSSYGGSKRYILVENGKLLEEPIPLATSKKYLFGESITMANADNYGDAAFNTATIGNYKLEIKDNKIGVYYNNKIIVDYTIDYVVSGSEIEGNGHLTNDMVMLSGNDLVLRNSSFYWDHDVITSLDERPFKTYLITPTGIGKVYNGYLNELYDTNYMYAIDVENSKVTFFNNKLDEVYSFYNKEVINNNTIDELNKKHDSSIIKDTISSYACYYTTKENYCYLNGKYIDILAQKEISEKEAYYVSLNNNYGYTLINNELSIYKNNEIVQSYKDIKGACGEYIIKYEDNNYGLYKIVFE